jgi:hypothetical protein
MTPKSKASSLFAEYASRLNDGRIAKQCALIAVREMIEMCEFDCIHNPESQRNIDKLNYLDEVEKELNNL